MFSFSLFILHFIYIFLFTFNLFLFKIQLILFTWLPRNQFSFLIQYLYNFFSFLSNKIVTLNEFVILLVNSNNSSI